jgi:hypothetical protein
MPGFAGVGALASAIEAGRVHEQPIFKTGSPTVAAGLWYDLSMGAGIPKYNAYVGAQLEGTPLVGSGNNGIYAGEPAAGMLRYLVRAALWDTTASRYPGAFVLCDYLHHYPLIDGDSTGQQLLDNTAPVQRLSPSGARIVLVCTTPNTSGNTVTATVGYLNQAGQARSVQCRINTGSGVGQVLQHQVGGAAAAQAMPWLGLADGDTGATAITSVQLDSAAGGFFAAVLVEPLCTLALNEAGTAVEYEFLQQRGALVQVPDGAYLNLFFSGTVASGGTLALRGLFTFARN